jgi:myosin-1
LRTYHFPPPTLPLTFPPHLPPTVFQRIGGFISILDEECIRPGEATPITLLGKLNDKSEALCTPEKKKNAFPGSSFFLLPIRFKGHAHYEYRNTPGGKASFILKHYAGEVSYDLDAFLDKNKDLLFKDLTYAMGSSKNSVIKQLFPETKKDADFKRPPSAGSQFKVR